MHSVPLRVLLQLYWYHLPFWHVSSRIIFNRGIVDLHALSSGRILRLCYTGISDWFLSCRLALSTRSNVMQFVYAGVISAAGGQKSMPPVPSRNALQFDRAAIAQRQLLCRLFLW
jgi:hypothetical protein